MLTLPVRSVTLVALCMAVAGCSSGEPLNPVTGKVTVGGKPATGATVIFHPDGPADVNAVVASGRAGPDGTFTLTTGDKPGAKAGKYIVTVVWPDPNKKITPTQQMMGVSPDDAPDLLRGRYDSRGKSDLRAEVKAGDNSLPPFDLK